MTKKSDVLTEKMIELALLEVAWMAKFCFFPSSLDITILLLLLSALVRVWTRNSLLRF